MAGWNDETLMWSQRHASETHRRWGLRHATPRYAAMIAENRVFGAIRDRFIAEGVELMEAIERAHAQMRANGIEEDWIENQCGGCAFYIALDGALGADYGVCTNGRSVYDGTVKFEHDGCEAHEYQPLVTVEDLESYRDALRVKLDRGYQADMRKMDREELKRVEKLLPDTAAQSAAPPPATSPA